MRVKDMQSYECDCSGGKKSVLSDDGCLADGIEHCSTGAQRQG